MVEQRKTDLDRAEEEQENKYWDNMAEYVLDCFERAKQHRDSIGVTDSIMDCLRRFRGKYNSEELHKFAGISVYRGLTGMLVRSAYSWLKDAYFNAQDRPWVISPTPEPELPEDVQEQLDRAIAQQMRESLISGSFNVQIAEQRETIINELRNTASTMAYQAAEERTKGMTRLIEDQLTEAEWKDVFEEFLLQVCVYPIAVLKGPVIRRKKVPVWNGNKYTFKTEPKYYFETVDPINFYPSPDSTNSQDGEFLIELMPMTRARLIEAKSMKNFSKEAINLLISEADHAYERQAQLRVDDTEMTDLDGVGRTSYKTDGYIFDVYVYHGRVSGDYVLEFLEDEDKIDEVKENFDKEVHTDWGVIDPYEDYEIEAWVSNGITIMMRMNAGKPIPYRPYYTTSCFKVPHSIYGECVPLVIADLQDEVNMAARARVYNMGMSSGPIIEADVSRFQDNDVPEQIMPWNVYPVQSNGIQGNNNAPALRFNNVPDHSGPLTAVMEEAWDKAHRISGIPPYMYGDNQGAAPTLGAFSLQYAGATKGIKTIIGNIDSDIIEKAIQQMYYYNMHYHKDDGIKADAQVKVRGAAGLIAQEQRQARPLELLNALGPILAQMDPDTALALARETLVESGYDPSKLAQGSGSLLEREAANRQIGPQGGPSIDGRSGSAQRAQAAGPNIPAPVPQ